MKKQNFQSLEAFDLSDYREITGEELYEINGGKEIENSIAAQAEAQPGDTVTNSHGETRVLTEGDIKWAQQQLNNKTTEDSNSSGSEEPHSTTTSDIPTDSMPQSYTNYGDDSNSDYDSNSEYTEQDEDDQPIKDIPFIKKYKEKEKNMPQNVKILQAQYMSESDEDRVVDDPQEVLKIVNNLGSKIYKYNKIPDVAKEYFSFNKGYNFVGEYPKVGNPLFSADTPEKDVKYYFENHDYTLELTEKTFSYYGNTYGWNYEQKSRGYEFKISNGNVSKYYYDINKDGWIDFQK